MWNNALFIMKHELKRSNWGKLVSVALYLYLGIFSGLIARGMYFSSTGIADRSLSAAVDIIFLCGISCLGFAMAGEYLTYHRTDFFSRKVQYMRQLPISISETVGAKYLQMGVTLIAQTLLFFLPFYFIGRISDLLTFGQSLAFILVWVYFGACMSVVFAYKELGGTGKSYMRFSLIFTVLLVAASVGIKVLGTGFLELTMQGAVSFGLWIIVLGAALSAFWIWLWFRLTVNKIRSRSFVR
ncbi:hypothetical protein ACFQI7_06970 [Paenibacillus allorhizosphaerae]|uniref:ABC transporter permease n=1 Tax=Paenibacillus allorhizosphaerae TaxID=2849866 RepID=A0ABM8VFU4_9BACL|nr:hypothetical protein [Paenibacillus allorhizosphaerae]CAG7636066.1 hypothetical protein PAECIP111802_02212 [Paenibacillus allorhizosphaerae]